MKSTRIAAMGSVMVGLGLAALLLPSAALAGGHVSWSVGVSTGFPVYGAPAPIYVQPRPVYIQPQPIYVQPRPVYVQRQPIYASPPPYYGGHGSYGGYGGYGGAVVAAPVLVGPPPVYPIGWEPRGHWRHRHGPGWRY